MQRFRQRGVGGGTSEAKAFEQSRISLSDILVATARHGRLVLGTAALVTALALAHLATAPPRYTATSLVELDPNTAKVFPGQPVLSEAPPLDDVGVATQLELLRSDTVLRGVVVRLGLAQDPEFGERAWTPFAALLGGAHPDPDAAAGRRVAEAVTVRRVGRSHVLAVSATSSTRDVAASIADAIADVFIQEGVDASESAARNATAWMGERLADLRARSVEASRRLESYRIEHGLLETDGRTLLEHQVADVSTRLSAARSASADLRAKLLGLDAMPALGSTTPAVAAATEALRNESVVRLRQQWVDVARRREATASRYGEAHAVTAKLDRDLGELQRLVEGEIRRVADGHVRALEIAAGKETALADLLADLTSKLAASRRDIVEARLIESRADVLHTLHDNLLGRVSEALWRRPAIPNARVLSKAQSAPRSALGVAPTLALALAGGLLAGLGLAIARDRLDGSLRCRSDVEARLGLPFLGDVSLAAISSPKRDQALNEPHTLRIAIDASGEVRRPTTIGFTSALPGEGTIEVASGVAGALATGAEHILLIDARTNVARLGVGSCVGQGNFARPGWAVSLDKVRVSGPKTPDTLTVSILGDRDAARSLMEEARRRYDRVVVGIPPLLAAADARIWADCLDGIVLVAAAGRTDAETIVETLEAHLQVKARLLGTVLTKIAA